MRRAAVVLLLLTGTAPAQEPERPAITGQVLDEEGFGVRATVEFGGVKTDCGRTGLFRLESASPSPGLLVVTAEGCYTEFRSVLLDAGVIRLRRRDPARLRLVFGGDAMMGRRFLKPDNQEAPKEALLRGATLAADTKALLAGVAPILTAGDHAIVNLETVLTRGEGTPVSKKQFSFWSPPETAGALASAGVDLVTLGNNHTWDYGDAGLSATMEALKAAKLAYCGAGRTEREAAASGWIGAGPRRVVVLSFSGIAGSDVPLQASGNRGGAAPMTLEGIRTAVSAAKVVGAPVVVALHAGTEYQNTPTERVRAAAEEAAKAGAAIVVCHHPHVISGFSIVEGALIAWGLGNFVFDQSRWEALSGMLLVVDLEDGRVTGASFLPLVHDAYVPRIAAPEFAQVVTRQVGAVSPDLPVFWSNGRAMVGIEEVHRVSVTRLAVVAPKKPLKLEFKGPAAFLAGALAPKGRVEAGSDVLRIGGFEDADTDGTSLEAGVWTLSRSRRISDLSPRSGRACLRIERKKGDKTSTSSTTHRIPMPASCTLETWTRAENGGLIQVELGWCAESEMKESRGPIILVAAGGTRDWTLHRADIDRPPGMFSARIRLSVQAPQNGEGIVDFDDLSLISWSRSALDLPSPNNVGWIRLVGAAEPQVVELTTETLKE